jgi:Putative beta-lactamase-inhibitor-like, PepSY-like
MKNLLLAMASLLLLIVACKNTDESVTPADTIMTGDVQLMGGGAGDPRPDSIHMPDSSRCGQSRRFTYDSLPAISKTYITTNYAGYSVIKVYKFTRNDTARFFVVVSKDTSTKVLVFDKTGKFQSVHNAVNGHRGSNHRGPVGGFSSTNITVDALLPVIKTYITANYTGYTIKKAEKESHLGISVYEVEIEKGSTKKKLLFDANGKFLLEYR